MKCRHLMLTLLAIEKILLTVYLKYVDKYIYLYLAVMLVNTLGKDFQNAPKFMTV